MVEQFFALGPWAWVILGLILLVLELAAPGTMFLWFGVAAHWWSAGSASLIDLSWQGAFIRFAVLSLISVIVGRMIMRRFGPATTDKPLLNERAQSLVGNVYQLDEPIENGQGRVKVHDSYWRVSGPDCPSGSRVRIIGRRWHYACR